MGDGKEPTAKAYSASPRDSCPAMRPGDSQLPSPSQITHFCSPVANDVIKFTSKPSVLSDRHSGYALREAHQNQGTWVTK